MSRSLKAIEEAFAQATKIDYQLAKQLTELAKLLNDNVKLENSNLKKEEKLWENKKAYFKQTEVNALRDIFPRAKQIFGRRGKISNLQRRFKDIQTVESYEDTLEITVYFPEGFYTGMYAHIEHLQADLLKLRPLI